MDLRNEFAVHFQRLKPFIHTKTLRRRGRTALTLLCTFFVLAGIVFAERLPVKIYTSADGLGSGFVDNIYRDSRGFMWFSTRDGLSRFDGARFVNYRVGTGEQAAPGVESIFESRSGVYYVSTTGGTFRIDPNQVALRSGSDRVLAAQFLTSGRGNYFQDSKGNDWFYSGPLNRIVESDGKTTFERIDLDLPPNPRNFGVWEMGEAPDGSLWLNTTWGTVRMLADGRKVFYPVENALGGSNSLVADKDGRIWLTLANRVFVIKPEPADAIGAGSNIVLRPLTPTAKFELKSDQQVLLPKNSGEIFEYTSSDENTFVENSYAKRIFQTSDGTIWISAENMLMEIAEGVFHSHDSSEGLPTVMTRMGEDSAGHLWIAGHSGLARLNRSGLVTFGRGDGVQSSRFFAITQDADGSVVLAGRDHTLVRFDGTRLTSVRPGVPANLAYLWTSRFAYHSSAGDWWILSNDRLYRFAGGGDFASLDKRAPAAVYDTESGLKANGAFQIFEDSQGSIWVSARGSNSESIGLSRMRKGESSFHPMGSDEGLPDGKSPASFAEDASGNIWMGFYEGGMAVFDGQKFRLFDRNDGLPPNGHVADIQIDAKGTIWLATSAQGLFRIKDAYSVAPRFEPIVFAGDSVSSNIRTITQDGFGRLYLGTARGVDRYSPETGHVKHFTVSDGLAADFVVDSLRDRNGDIWFVTNNGASRLTPQPDEKPLVPQVFIGSLQISGAVQQISELGSANVDRGELTYTDNNFQIDFFGLDLRAGEFLRYQYMLEGADQDWSAATDQTTVTFANLQPGSYRFLVRAVNTEGVSSDRPATVTFIILKPVWLRWWFILLAVVLLAGVIILLFRYRTTKLLQVNAALEDARRAEERLRRSREDRLMELERVRSRIATDLHDDIGASLTQIAILSEVAQAGATNGNSKLVEPLSKISEVSNELVGTMSDIVWSINPAKDHLRDLTQRMRRFAADVLSERGIAVKLTIPDTPDEISLNSNVRREVFLVFKEAINNVAKHANASNVRVDLGVSATQVILAVKDDGDGFTIESPTFEDTFTSEGRSGNGLQSMKQRAKEMGGEFEIGSEPGKGTIVCLRLPREQAFDESLIPNAAIRRDSR